MKGKKEKSIVHRGHYLWIGHVFFLYLTIKLYCNAIQFFSYLKSVLILLIIKIKLCVHHNYIFCMCKKKFQKKKLVCHLS